VLEKVITAEKKLTQYQGIIDDLLLEEVNQIARDLRGLRVCNITSTPFGGGVPEILCATVPIEQDLEIQADWYALRSNDKFLNIAKVIHNALQGAPQELGDEEKQLYLQYNSDIAADFADNNYDVVILHNHHLLALPHFISSKKARWIWRCHLDSSEPDKAAWTFLKPLIEEYQGAIFTMQEFIPADLKLPVIKTIAPAIDPLSLKNRDVPLDQSLEFVSSLGIDPQRPILLHVSRLDKWKDPMGIIECFFAVKNEIPDLQLVIISSLTLDDPETFSTLRLVDAEASKDEDIHVYTNIDGIGDIEVNVFQRVCSVGILKSLREGFGLAVSETLWKGKPVIGSRVGGIPLQLTGQLDYCLVSNIRECAEKIVRLIADNDYARELGNLGREHVRKNFLTPRLVRDELAMMRSVIK